MPSGTGDYAPTADENLLPLRQQGCGKYESGEKAGDAAERMER